jgi:transcriptional regulator with XRE-family HTH domain
MGLGEIVMTISKIPYPDQNRAEYRPLTAPRFATAVLACAFLVGTGGATTTNYLRHRGDRGYRFPQVVIPENLNANFREPAENLKLVRDVFKFSISDLAHALNVSRQTVYNWMAGETPLPERTNRIDDLAQAADLITAHGLNMTAYASKRKLRNGKTLIEIVQEGGSAQNAVLNFIQIATEESNQHKLLQRKFVGRPRAKIEDAEFGIPKFEERMG